MLIELTKRQAESESRKFGRIATAANTADVSDSMIRKLLKDGRLTRYRLGNATLVDLRELDQLIQPEEIEPPRPRRNGKRGRLSRQ